MHAIIDVIRLGKPMIFGAFAGTDRGGSHHGDPIRLYDGDLQRGRSPSPDAWETTSAIASPIFVPVVQPDRDNPQQIKSMQLARKPATASASESRRAFRKVLKENASLRQEVIDLKQKLSESDERLARLMNAVECQPADADDLAVVSGPRPPPVAAAHVPKLGTKPDPARPARFLGPAPLSSGRSEPRSDSRNRPAQKVAAAEPDEQQTTIRRLRKLVESFQNEVISKANEIAQLRQRNAMLLLMNSSDPGGSTATAETKPAKGQYDGHRRPNAMLQVSGETIVPAAETSTKTAPASSMALPITTADVVRAHRNPADDQRSDASMMGIFGSAASSSGKSRLLFELDANESRAWNELVGRIAKDHVRLKKIESRRQHSALLNADAGRAKNTQFLCSLRRSRLSRPGSQPGGSSQ